MEETQMTDSELIKALENSINTYNEKGVYVDTENLQQQVLDLIKRQRAEIERLEKARQKQAYLLCNLKGQKYELINRISVIKNEAYKEFADKVKQELMPYDLGAFSAVRAVLKDLTGEDTNDLQIL